MPIKKMTVKPSGNGGAPQKAPLAMRKTNIFNISQPREKFFTGSNVEIGKVNIVDFVNDGLNMANDLDTLDVKEKESNDTTSPKHSHPFLYRDRMSWMAMIYTLIPAVGIPGIKYAMDFRENKIRRLFWVIFIMAGFGLTCIQVLEGIKFYIRYPTSINVDIDYEDELPLPAIAICNVNRYRREMVEGTPFGNLVASFTWGKGTSRNLRDFEEALNGTNMTQMLLDFSHPLNETILLVRLGLVPVPVSNFSVKFTDYGVCYTFNSGEDGRPPVYIKASGFNFGLSVVLHARQEWYYFEELNRSNAGFHIILYERGTEPVQDVGFSIKPGTATDVALKMQKLNNLPRPWGECKDKELINYPYYGQYECYKECMSDYIFSRCGCKSAMLPGDIPHCDPIQYFGCGSTAYVRFLQEQSHACDCPNPCFQVNYNREMSYSSYPSNYIAEFAATSLFNEDNITSEYIRDNLGYMNVFFKDLTIEHVNQTKAYDLFSLLCDIGGSLGLWLGGSILTVFEFCDLFGHSAYLYSRKAR